MILRLSQKLSTKIDAGTLASMPLDENPYADWSCHSFTADRTQYVLLTNTKSLYSCVMFGRGVTDEGKFIERALSTIREFMEDDGQEFVYRRFVAPSSETVSFAKAFSRSVTGSMNELVQTAKRLLREEEISPHEIGFQVNDILLSALSRSKSDFYWKPNEAFKRLLLDIEK